MADERTYIRVHDGMPDHPKVDPLSDGAFRLLISGWCWCSRHLTDGVMPKKTWHKRGTSKARQELLDVGLVETVANGDVFWHDYLQHQRSAAQVAEMKEQRRSAGRAGGLARSKRVAKQTPSESLSNSPSKIQASTERTTEQKTSSSVARKRATQVPDEFPITPQMHSWGREHAPLIADPVAETAQFLDHHRAKGSTFKDWTAAWRTWMANAQKFAEQRGGASVRQLRPTSSNPHDEWGFA